MRPCQKSDGIGVEQSNCFRSSGGTRGVDAIGKVLRLRVIDGIDDRLLRNGRPVLLQTHRVRAMLRQALFESSLRQQHRRSRVGEHVCQSFGRVLRIQRHIRASRFQDPQQPHHHLQRALDANAHQRIGPDSKCAQMMRQLIRLAIELAVGQLSVFKGHRSSPRPPRRLLLEQLVDTPVVREFDLGIIPLNQQLMPIGVS